MERYGEKPKFGNKQWFENYWYHYKWHTIVGIIAVVVLAMFIKDIVSREKYDATVLLASRVPVSYEQQEQIKSIMERYETDQDGNGDVNINLMAIQFPRDEYGANAQVQMAEQVKFMAELSTAEAFVYILDEYSANMLSQQGSPFMDLSEHSDKTTGAGERILLSETVLGADPMLSEIADSLWISFRGIENTPKKDDKTIERNGRAFVFLGNLLNDIPVSAVN